MKSLLASLMMLLAAAAPAAAQSAWGDLDGLLMRSLTAGTPMEGAFWLPDAPDPSTAREAIGVAYTHIPGSAGSLSISVGYFVRQNGQFVLSGIISDLFGHNPRQPVFAPDHMAITTTTLRPDEPRCCPTGETTWIIDRRSLRAVAAN
ncbi:MAG: hypothetical protein KDA50_08300 [Rhodobacteraceae bacterium]|nr:hypothetical protein [Paracoccaceae bacterium]